VTAVGPMLNDMVRSRELLLNLTRRELRARYKRSALGFAWSMLNPLLMMGVFTIVFGTIFAAPVADFPLFFLAGYLPWSFFQASAMVGTSCVVANGPLITKVYFPRALLPVSVVLSQLVHFGLALLVFFAALLVVGYNFLPYLPVLVAGVALLALFATGVSMFLAALNTTVRDVQEFTPVLFLLWFYATPVVYPVDLVPSGRLQTLIQANPLTSYVTVVRNCLYDLELPSAATWGLCLGWAIVSIVVGTTVFNRLSSRFAKEV
jgi:ABC-type polysaccharide/polyol phosphate export permease